MAWLENIMYQLSDFFLAPVLILLVILFAYSLFSFGGFTLQAWQRRQAAHHYQRLLKDGLKSVEATLLRSYVLAALAVNKPTVTKDQLDVAALVELEGVRTVSRLAPMLGLIATMVPMGPALKNLGDGNIQGISENLVVAFSAVIFGLVIASITFWIASVKKRWLAVELVAITPMLAAEQNQSLREVMHEAA